MCVIRWIIKFEICMTLDIVNAQMASILKNRSSSQLMFIPISMIKALRSFGLLTKHLGTPIFHIVARILDTLNVCIEMIMGNPLKILIATNLFHVFLSIFLKIVSFQPGIFVMRIASSCFSVFFLFSRLFCFLVQLIRSINWRILYACPSLLCVCNIRGSHCLIISIGAPSKPRRENQFEFCYSAFDLDSIAL